MPEHRVAACDRCAFVVRIPSGYALPTGWRSDPYDGRILCPRCVEAVDAERSYEKALKRGVA